MNSKSYANSGGYKEEEIGYSTSNLLKRLRKVEADVKEANLLAHPTTSKQQRLEANAFVQAPLVDADSYSFEYSESTSLTQELSVSRIDSPKKAVKPSIRKGQDAWFVLIALYIKGEGQQSSELEVEKELLNINPKSRGGVGASLEKAVQAGLAVRRGRSFALTASGFKKSEGFYYDYLAGEVKAEPIRSSKPKTVAGDSRVSSSIVLEASAAPASRNEIALEEFTFAFDVPSSPSLRVSASSSALSLAPALKSRPTTAHVVSVTGASEVIDLLDSDDEDQKQGCKVVAKPQEEVIDLCASPPSAVAASSSGPSLIQRLRSIAAEKRLETAAPAVASSSQAAATSSSSSVLGRREAVSHASGLRPMTLSDERPNKVPWSEHYNGLVPLPLPRELYEVVLVVDERERQKDFVDGNLNCAYCRSTLAIGDFIFVGRPRGNDGMNGAVVLDCIIERKIPNDLASSICDGRYAEQKTRMRACGLAHMMYLVEGELILTRARIPPGALRTCVGATPIVDDIRVVRTRSIDHTVQMLDAMHKQIERRFEEGRCAMDAANQRYLTFEEFQAKNRKGVASTVGELFGHQVRQVPDCGPGGSSALVKRFKTMKGLLDFAATKTADEFIDHVANLKRNGTGRVIGSKVAIKLRRLFRLK